MISPWRPAVPCAFNIIFLFVTARVWRTRSRVFCCWLKAAATEELREAGQRKIGVFAERAAAAERQAREVTAKMRALESGQAALQASDGWCYLYCLVSPWRALGVFA